MDLPINYKEITRLLPHRYPFLLVDRVIEFEPLKKIVALKCVTSNEPFFQGHFPGEPIMPGVLIVEAMAQAGGILSRLSFESDSEQESPGLLIFLGIDKVKFRRQVIPGDQLRFEVETIRTGSRVWKLSGKTFVEDSLAAQAEMTAQIG